MNDRETLERLVKIGLRFRCTPIVDDDFPAYRNAFDYELEAAERFLTDSKQKMVIPGVATLFPGAKPEPEEGGSEGRCIGTLKIDLNPEKPEVVCLCGSTRFWKEFQEANYKLTMEGKIVLTVGFYPHIEKREGVSEGGNRWYEVIEHKGGENVGCTPEQKVELDKLHFKKIEMADRTHILNVGGYIGESTRNEINHARSLGKPVTYLEN